MLGLTACAMLHSSGAEVICADPDPHRREWALRFGAKWTVSPAEMPDAVKSRTHGHGVDAAFEFSGAGLAIPAGLASVRIGGSFILVGAVFPTQSLTIEPEQFIRRHLRMFGIHNYTPADLGDALKFLASHPEYPFNEMVSRWFPLREVTAAIEFAHSPGVMRVGIRPDK
jgi:threonine dehydrogenase-like Zn-dependent dehydrogenase